MRETLKELVRHTIILKYELPNRERGIERTPLTTHKDRCYNIANDDNLVDIIYNSIIEYSFNEFDINRDDYNRSMNIALQTKIRENPEKSHGFFGEVLLHSILCEFFNTEILIARGYFYCPTSKNEVTGFDSYHLIQYNDRVQLWFGEAKFRLKYHQAIDEIIQKLSSTLSDDYLRSNILAFENHKTNLNLQGSIVEKILNDFKQNPQIIIADKLCEYNVSLVYPVLMVYDGGTDNYDNNIKKILNYLVKKYNEISPKISLSTDYTIFFMLIPIKSVNTIKDEVIKCIKLKKPVI